MPVAQNSLVYVNSVSFKPNLPKFLGFFEFEIIKNA